MKLVTGFGPVMRKVTQMMKLSRRKELKLLNRFNNLVETIFLSLNMIQVSKSEESLPENQRTINLVLRMRNTKRELNDIRFEFQPTKVF